MAGDKKTAPIRIAQVLPGMTYDGVDVMVTNYYRHFDRQKFQFDFIDLEGYPIPQRKEIESLGARIYLVPRYMHPFQYMNRLEEIFTQNQYPIVHTHVNAMSVLPLYAAKKAGIPNRVAHNHSTAGKGETARNIIKYALRPWAGKFCTEKSACSEHAGKWLFGEDAEFTVFHSAFDLEKFTYNQEKREDLRRRMGLDGKFVIGHVGRFCYQKNHDLLIDIFAQVVKERKDAVLLLFGEGKLLPEIRKKVQSLGLRDRVRFLGHRLDVNRFYQVMDVFILPSRYEGLGLVGIEAQACGLPCVFSDQVPFDTKILDSTLYVKEDAPLSSWASAIFEVSENHVRRDTTEELRAAGYDICLESKKLERFYESLLE